MNLRDKTVRRKTKYNFQWNYCCPTSPSSLTTVSPLQVQPFLLSSWTSPNTSSKKILPVGGNQQRPRPILDRQSSTTRLLYRLRPWRMNTAVYNASQTSVMFAPTMTGCRFWEPTTELSEKTRERSWVTDGLRVTDDWRALRAGANGRRALQIRTLTRAVALSYATGWGILSYWCVMPLYVVGAGTVYVISVYGG